MKRTLMNRILCAMLWAAALLATFRPGSVSLALVAVADPAEPAAVRQAGGAVLGRLRAGDAVSVLTVGELGWRAFRTNSAIALRHSAPGPRPVEAVCQAAAALRAQPGARRVLVLLGPPAVLVLDDRLVAQFAGLDAVLLAAAAPAPTAWLELPAWRPVRCWRRLSAANCRSLADHVDAARGRRPTPWSGVVTALWLLSCGRWLRWQRARHQVILDRGDCDLVALELREGERHPLAAGGTLRVAAGRLWIEDASGKTQRLPAGTAIPLPNGNRELELTWWPTPRRRA
ncbi:MAG: hypothetical protein IT204_26085 [Fimbriimonadaceae bacterium]|nr:hypothetical protein [Fimbriimonadaceae bacterium]